MSRRWLRLRFSLTFLFLVITLVALFLGTGQVTGLESSKDLLLIFFFTGPMVAVLICQFMRRWHKLTRMAVTVVVFFSSLASLAVWRDRPNHLWCRGR